MIEYFGLKSELFESDIEYRNFIDNLRNNIITKATGIGKLNIISEHFSKKQEIDGKVYNYTGECCFDDYVISFDNINGFLNWDTYDKRYRKLRELRLVRSKYIKGRISPDNLLAELKKHKEVPSDTVSKLTIRGCIIGKNTIFLLNEIFPNLKHVDISSCLLEDDAYFSTLKNVEWIHIYKTSTIRNMRIFANSSVELLTIENSKITGNTTEHLNINIKTLSLKKSKINMPMFLINTDMPNCKTFEVEPKETMCNLDASFLSFENLNNLTFYAIIHNLEIFKRLTKLSVIRGIEFDLSKCPELMQRFQKELKKKTEFLRETGWTEKNVKHLLEQRELIDGKMKDFLIRDYDLSWFNLTLKDHTLQFYDFIRVMFDSLDRDNWLNKSTKSNLEDIKKELLTINQLPFHLRQQIGRTKDTTIKPSKPSDVIDILNELRKKNLGEEKEKYEPIGIYDVYGNLMNPEEKVIYDLSYGQISRLEKEREWVEETRISKLVRQFVPNKSHELSYIFKEFLKKINEKSVVDYEKLTEKTTTMLDETCPECGHNLMIKNGKHGSFISCSNFPECKYIKNELTGEDCPTCGSPLIVRVGRFGSYAACSDYPNCKYTKSIKKEKGFSKSYDVLDFIIDKYIENSLNELYEQRDKLLSFSASDYEKIKDSLPKIYTSFLRDRFEVLVYLSMTYKYATGSFPSMLETAFSFINAPESIKKLDEDGRIEIVSDDVEKVYGSYVKRNKYRKKKGSNYYSEDDYDENPF